MLVGEHVNKINNDDATQVAQAQLPCNRLRCLEIGFKNGIVQISCANITAGIDIDGRHRFGLVDHQVAAGFEVDASSQGFIDLRINIV